MYDQDEYDRLWMVLRDRRRKLARANYSERANLIRRINTMERAIEFAATGIATRSTRSNPQ